MAKSKVLKLVIQNRDGSTIADFDWPMERDIPQYLQVSKEGSTIFTCSGWSATAGKTQGGYVVYSPADQKEIKEFWPSTAEGKGYHYQSLPGFYRIVNSG